MFNNFAFVPEQEEIVLLKKNINNLMQRQFIVDFFKKHGFSFDGLLGRLDTFDENDSEGFYNYITSQKNTTEEIKKIIQEKRSNKRPSFKFDYFSNNLK